MKKIELNLGKWEGTHGMNNDFWIKKFENGVKIRKKGQGELTLSVSDVFDILITLRKFGKRQAFPIFLHSIDLIPIWQKYPETKEFCERIILDKVGDKEKIKIHKGYMAKVNIIKNLEEK